VTQVRLWNEHRDLMAEYIVLKEKRPDEACAIRDAITVIWTNPDIAGTRYSIRLDPVAGYMAMPFVAPTGLTCLVWRHSPDGDDVVEIVDWHEPWDDLDMPPVWPRPNS